MVPLTVLQGHLVGLRKRLNGEGTAAELVVAALEETHYLASLVHNLGAAAHPEMFGVPRTPPTAPAAPTGPAVAAPGMGG